MLKIEINGEKEVFYLPENWKEVKPKAFTDFLKLSDKLSKGKLDEIEYLIEIIKTFMGIDDKIWNKFDASAQMTLIKEMGWLSKQEGLNDNTGNIKIGK